MLTFKSKFLQYIARQKLQQGFTLLELLITVIIVGILAAIAVPNLLAQAAKGRQAEAVTNLGAINRAQLTYRYENGTFAALGDGSNSARNINNWTLPVKVKIQTEYYKYLDKAPPTATTASYYGDVLPKYDYDLKDYSASVALTETGVFSAIICGAINANPVGGMGNSTDGTTCGFNSVPVK